MRALALYAVFVIFCTAGAIFIGKSIEGYTSPDISSIVMLGLFFVGLDCYSAGDGWFTQKL
jgi:hypothetical protein